MEKKQLKNISLEELQSEMLSIGEKKFRAQQVMKWIYQKRVDTYDEMVNIPKALRVQLDLLYSIQKLGVHQVLESKAGDAVKFAFTCIESSHVIESVLLIDGDRRTACLSSQLGCGMGCVFCETAKMGFVRNLSQAEIVGQLIGIDDYLASRSDKPVTNIVFMGMGEALFNYENFRKSLDIIMNEETFNIGGRRINVSTAGVIPSIERLMSEKLNIGLAISLNAYNNEQRSQLMPVNKKYPIEQLVAIARKYYNATGRRVTFEYVLIDGETNTPEALDALKQYLGGLPCKVNLIPVNPHTNSSMKGPNDSNLEQFSEELHRRGITATIRKSRGQDISGACGQLAGRINNTI